MGEFESLIRPNILKLVDYVKPQTDIVDNAIRVQLNANENPCNAPHNRYAPNNGEKLKETLGKIHRIWPHCIALCKGTDEAVDFIMRIFCSPGKDNILAIEPTTRKYAEYALLNDIAYRPYPLNNSFQLDANDVLSCCDEYTKVIFLCSPNNPTGNLLLKSEILKLCENFKGIVMIDEGYHDFALSDSSIRSISTHHNLVVVNSLSKAYASADLRLSIIYGIPEIVRYVNTIAPHHHVSSWTETKALDILNRRFEVDKWIRQLLEERRKVMEAIRLLPICTNVYPSQSNFFMAKMQQADEVCNFLKKEGIAVYNCGHMTNCHNCLRITIGLPSENNMLIGALRKYVQSIQKNRFYKFQ